MAEPPSNLDVLLSAIHDELAAQHAQVSMLDTKANFGLAMASLLTMALVGLRNANLDAAKTATQLPSVRWVTWSLYSLIFEAFVLLAITLLLLTI